MNKYSNQLFNICGVLGLLISLGLGLWLATVVVAFGLGALIRPRLESTLRRLLTDRD